MVLVVKNPPTNTGAGGDAGSIPGVGKIPWSLMEEAPGRLQSRGLHDWSNLARTHAPEATQVQTEHKLKLELRCSNFQILSPLLNH